MAHVKQSPAPLFVYMKAEATRGIRHSCYRFVAIGDPLAFAEARDRARNAERQKCRERESSRHIDCLRAQSEHLQGNTSEQAMAAEVRSIVESVRGKLPRKVAKSESRFRHTLGRTA
jgi:hypothetical protein